jgi:hypothetical protein
MIPLTQPLPSQALLTAALVAFIAWRMYARVRRTIGRQQLSPVRPWISVLLFPVLLALLALASRTLPLAEGCLLGGTTLGIALGVLGLRLTRFEDSPEGRYYTPSAHIGVVLSTLLVCRVAYRLLAGGLPSPAAAAASPAGHALTPLTLLLVGTLAGYYCSYAAGLLRWARRAGAARA